MKTLARRKVRLIVTAAILVLIPLSYLYFRFPLSTGHGTDYYTNYIFVYERQSRNCGLLACFGPDIFPFTRDTVVRGAHPSSFRFVGAFNPSIGEVSTANDIFADKYHVIYQGEVIWDSDPDSLKLFDGYAKDKNHVYLRGYVSKKLDPATFELLGCGFYRDKNGVYNHFMGFENRIAEIDRETFEVINPRRCNPKAPYTAKDKNHLYKSSGGSGFEIIK